MKSREPLTPAEHDAQLLTTRLREIRDATGTDDPAELRRMAEKARAFDAQRAGGPGIERAAS